MPTTTQCADASELLRSWVYRGAFDSELVTYLDRSFRGNESSWYARVLSESGVAEADRRLGEWLSRRRMAEVASSVRPTAKAAAELVDALQAQRDPDVHVIRQSERLRSLGIYGASDSAAMVLVFNRGLPDCGCTEPEGTAVFGTRGVLGLQAVGLCFDPDMRAGHYDACLTLVLRSRSNNPIRGGYCAVNYNTTGLVGAKLAEPQFVENGVIKSLLGVTENPFSVLHTSGGDLDDVIGFPNAGNYIIDQLPLLAGYLLGMAGTLREGHKH